MAGPSGGFAVIGGGPAGLMAAETLAKFGAEVTVYDRMPSVGRKFLLAGRGGLNLTHGEPLDAFVARYGAAARRLGPILDRFPPDALRDWAAALGQPTVAGSSGRVFPASWKASPLLRAWLRRLDGLGVKILTRHRWTGFAPGGRLAFETPNGSVVIPPPAGLVLALGGASWPRLGSDGSWTAVLDGLGVPQAPLRPSNSALLVPWSDRFRERFAGEPLKRISLAACGKVRRGEAVVTATGLEGGIVYALSGDLRDMLERGERAVLHVDLKPDRSTDELASAFRRPRARQSLSTFLRKTARLPPVAIALLREATGPTLPSDPDGLARLVKAVPVAVEGVAGLDRAISTAGGIGFDGLDDDLMLQGHPGVFAAGEMLDWEAPTGGYLLQACFATGSAAAEGALAWAARRATGQSSAPERR